MTNHLKFKPVEQLQQPGSQFEMCSVMEMSVFAAANFPFIREAEKLLDTCHINHSTAASTLELQTKVYTKVRYHSEGPYEGVLLVERHY